MQRAPQKSLSCVCRGADSQGATSDAVARASSAGSHPKGAQGMDTLHTFKPTLRGAASMKALTCKLHSNDQETRVIDDDDDGAAATEHGYCENEADATENNAGAATEHVEASAAPLDLPAEKRMLMIQWIPCSSPRRTWNWYTIRVGAYTNKSSNVCKQKRPRRPSMPPWC